MKINKTFLLTFLFLALISNYSFSQTVENFYSFSKNKNLVKRKIYYFKDNKHKYIKQQIVYFGIISTNDKNSYKVFHY